MYSRSASQTCASFVLSVIVRMFRVPNRVRFPVPKAVFFLLVSFSNVSVAIYFTVIGLQALRRYSGCFMWLENHSHHNLFSIFIRWHGMKAAATDCVISAMAFFLMSLGRNYTIRIALKGLSLSLSRSTALSSTKSSEISQFFQKRYFCLYRYALTRRQQR